jgi:hypothetical protein
MKWVIAAGAGITGLIMLAAITAAVAGNVPSTAGTGYGPSAVAQDGIPPEYLALYQSAAATEGLDWTVLAGIGKVETNHGRSTQPGVHSGVNFAGCCAGPMQFNLHGTWQAYGDGGDVYNPADAIPAAARYLKASGAPGDYHRAILAYNHSEAYYGDVMTWAERYRGDPGSRVPGGTLGGGTAPIELGPGERWLMPVPGTSSVCDRRIVPDVVWILATYNAAANDCYAGGGHAAGGEHPLGLGIDLGPGPGGSWAELDKLAHDLGWRESCASTGCAEQSFIRPMRFIGWRGYPNHGPPGDCVPCTGGPHLHLSWAHSPGPPPVKTVYTLRENG